MAKIAQTSFQAVVLLRWAHTLTPRLYDFLVPYIFEWGAFLSEEAGKGPGNVFEPMPHYNRITGGWRDRRNALLRRGALVGGAALVPLVAYRAMRRRR